MQLAVSPLRFLICCLWEYRHQKAHIFKNTLPLTRVPADFKWVWGEGNGNPLQYSCLENPMDGGAWWAAVHRVAKSRTQLSDFTFTFHFHTLEKEMATHSSVLAWRIPGTGEPGGLLSLGSHRVGHDWSDLAAAAAVPPRKPDFSIHEHNYLVSSIFYRMPTLPSLFPNMRTP